MGVYCAEGRDTPQVVQAAQRLANLDQVSFLPLARQFVRGMMFERQIVVSARTTEDGIRLIAPSTRRLATLVLENTLQ